jgi:hypothetical protein
MSDTYPVKCHEAAVVWVCLFIIGLTIGGVIGDRVLNGGRAVAWIDGQVEAQGAPKAAPVDTLRYLPKQGGTPDVVLITKVMPETWQVCAQRKDSDAVDCKPVGEVRAWLRLRAPMEMKR